MSEQTTCGPEAEQGAEATDIGGFEPIEMTMDADPVELDGDSVVSGGDALPVDDTPEIKAAIVHKLLGSTMALPNYILLAKNQPPLQSLDIEQYDKNMNGLGKKAAAQLARMVDVNPTFAKWLMQAVEFERKYGDLGMFGATVLRSVVMEMSMRKQQAEEEAKKAEAEKQKAAPAGEEPAEAEAADVLQGTIDEPEE